MASDSTSLRFPWVALALSFLSSGVGHIYCGRIVIGALLVLGKVFAAAAVDPRRVRATFQWSLARSVAGACGGDTCHFPLRADRCLCHREASWSRLRAEGVQPGELVRGARRNAACLSGRADLGTSRVCLRGVPHPDGNHESQFSARRSNFGEQATVRRRLSRARRFGRVSHAVVGSRTRWIKRVIGVAGDQVVIKGREIEVNGKRLERERVPTESIARIREHVEGDVHYESHAGRRYRVLFRRRLDRRIGHGRNQCLRAESQHIRARRQSRRLER